MTPLRVCHLSKSYPPAAGGIETHVRTLALAQSALGAEVSVLCVGRRGEPTSREHDGPVAVTRVGRAAGGGKLDYCPGLSAAVAATGADVLHLQVPNPTMVLALLRARPRAPLVLTYQSDVVRQRLRGRLFRPFERLLYRRVRAVLTTSPGYAGGSAFLRRYADRTEMVPNGIDLGPYLDPSRDTLEEAARIRSTHRGPLWLGCGRLVYYKGFVNAVRALTRVEGTLLLVGGGPDRAMLEAEARRCGVDRRVAFCGELGHYLDLAPYYHAADALWFPSNARSEAFGLVQVEAMAAGCPVINAAIPDRGVPWVSRHGREGLTVPVDDPAALADAAQRLINEPGLRDRLAAAARARATAEFDHRTMAARTLGVYRRVLGAAAPAAAGALAHG